MISQNDDLRSRSFPVQEDMPLQVKLWRAERIGWCLFFLVVLVALLGLFGTGPLSKTEAVSSNGELLIQYDRFDRNGASNEMIVKAKADEQGKVWLIIGGALLQRFTIEGIQPEPANAEGFGDGMKLELKPDSEGWATAYFALRATGIGPVKTNIRSGGQSVEVGQFIYP